MIDSTITLVSNSEGDVTEEADCIDVRLEYVRICKEKYVNMQPDYPPEKYSKKRFESRTTSIPGKLSAILFPASET